MRTTLTNAQLRFLLGLAQRKETRWSHCNYSGTPQQLREVLTRKGLISHFTVDSKGRHLKWSRYSLTELGESVLCATKFDEGLAAGFESFVQEVDRKLTTEAWEREQQVYEAWGTTEVAVREVRKALGVMT